MSETSQFEGCPRRLTKDNHMDKEVGKRKAWERTCVERGLKPKKLNTLVKTRFASKVICLKRH
jgi:hypothetical protein